MKTFFLFILVAALLSGCSPTKSDISDNPTPDNQIYISGIAQVNSPSNTGKAAYSIYCMLEYTDTSRNNSDFNSANVTVNGVALKRYSVDGYFQNLGTTTTFSEGDSLEFVIKHRNIGTVRKVMYVPQSLPDVSVSPGFSTANLPNTATTFTLSWTPVSSEYYLVQAQGLNYWETALVADTTFVNSSGSATVVLKDSAGNACPWVVIQVESFNFLPIDGFAAGSGFGVSGASYVVKSNMPNVGSITRSGAISGRRIRAQ